MKKNLGILYNFPFVYFYFIAMNILYGKGYHDRYKKIADEIAPFSSVVDVCCGDAKLYQYLKPKKVRYLGLDISKSFVQMLNKRGVEARLFDIRKDTIPKCDYIVIQGSLYQFKKHAEIINKLYTATKKVLIVAEPVKKFEDSFIGKTFVRWVVPFLVGTENNDKHFRFSEKEFRKLLEKYKPNYIRIKGERDLIAVIKKNEVLNR